MKKLVCAIALLAVVMAGPVLAQGPFTDVPTDHWAYEAVNQLAQDGVIVGYPDGTFGGKRAMTRFEFAQALARAIPVIISQVQQPVAPPTPADTKALEGRVSALEGKTAVDTSAFATKADVDALKKLTDEFKDELAAMGVDIDALKRDVAALGTRVTALENEIERVKITGSAMFGVIGEDVNNGTAIDRDGKTLAADDDLLETLTMVRDLDLTITGRVSDDATAVAVINAGNYLNYVSTIHNLTGGPRAVGAVDGFFPYYAYLNAPLLGANVTVGRFPLQWTPYTLKMIDVDSYFNNAKTDSGDFPLDGAKIAFKMGGIGVQAFAAKWDGVVDGIGYGNLTTVDQLAGARVTLGTPMKGNLGLTYVNSASSDTALFDGQTLVGADLGFDLGMLGIAAEWAQTDTEGKVSADDIDVNNTALDASIAASLGGLGLTGGWKSIEDEFRAPGYWNRYGRDFNVTNIRGPYVGLKYGIAKNVNLTAKGEFLSEEDSAISEFDLRYYDANLRLGLGASTSFDLGLEWVKIEPLVGATTDEKYINIGLGYQLNPNTGAKISYQIADFDEAGSSASDYKGNLAVAQVSVKF